MQSNETQLTRRQLGVFCAAQIGTMALHLSASAGGGVRVSHRAGKLSLTEQGSVSKLQPGIPGDLIGVALTLLKTGKRSPDTSNLRIYIDIEHAKGVPIYKRELQFAFGGSGLKSASSWGADGEHVILVDYPRLRDFLHWGEEYIFKITTLDAIPSKGLGDQFLSFYYLSK